MSKMQFSSDKVFFSLYQTSISHKMHFISYFFNLILNSCFNIFPKALQIEQEARQEVIKVYKEILKQKEESHQRHINALQTKYEDEIARLKYYYEKQKQEEIVNLDSSDDSANSSLELQGTLFTYKAELQEKDKILEDAVSAFKEVQEEVCELKKENLKLLDELEIYKNSSKPLQPSDESTSADEQESDGWFYICDFWFVFL